MVFPKTTNSVHEFPDSNRLQFEMTVKRNLCPVVEMNSLSKRSKHLFQNTVYFKYLSVALQIM